MAKKRTLNIETIKAQSGIEKEIKIHLDKCPSQAVRSIPLTEWTRELCTMARRLKHTDEEIINWVVTYANRGNWSHNQISYVLTEQGISRYDRYSETGLSDTDIYRPIDLVKTFKRIINKLSKMPQDDIIDTDYSPDRITEIAERNLVDWITRMNEGNLRINKKLTKVVIALLKRSDELMQQRERSISKLGDMR